MKFIKLVSAIIVLITSSNVNAASMYYTFDGYIDNFGIDQTGEATSAGLGYMSQVSYTVEIDFSGTASLTHPDNTIEDLSDVSGNYYGWYSTDYFYASLIESSHPLLSASKPLTLSDDIIDSNIGYSVTSTSTVIIDGVSSIGYDYSGTLNLADSLTIQSQTKQVQDWEMGYKVNGFYSYGDRSDGSYNTFGLNLTLTNISPVPLPAAAWLFASGFIGLVGFVRRKK